VQRERVGVTDGRDEQAPRRRRGDPEPDPVVVDDLLGGLVPARVEHRCAAQRQAHRLGDERQRAQREGGELARAAQPVAQLHRGGHVDGEELRHVRGGEGAGHHCLRGRPPDAADALAAGAVVARTP
jgi:hypothetical protein